MRLLEILFYLLKSNSKTTVKQLAYIFNVSPKTIQRDLDKLSVLGIPIISYRGVNGGIELDKNYIIAKYVLTESDYKDLILSLYISEHIIENLKKSDLIDKFKLVNHNRCTEILDSLEKRLIVDLDDQRTSINNDICKIINNSLDNKTYVKLESEGKVIEVFPISYVLKKEGLYLYCYDGEYKLILIDNISNVTNCEKVYEGKIIPYKDNKDKKII